MVALDEQIRVWHEKSPQAEVLTSIPGIGPLRRKNLLKFFGSVAKMKKASTVELAKAPGMSTKLAQEVFDYLKGA